MIYNNIIQLLQEVIKGEVEEVEEMEETEGVGEMEEKIINQKINNLGDQVLLIRVKKILIIILNNLKNKENWMKAHNWIINKELAQQWEKVMNKKQ
jgi:hypothetical protein